MRSSLDAGQTGLIVDIFNDFIEMVAKPPFLRPPSLIGFFGESAGAKMNRFRTFGFEYFGKLNCIVTRASAGKNTCEHALIISCESFFLFRHAFKAIG
jgi:hypothetical protein